MTARSKYHAQANAVEMGRKGIGFELKPSYFAQAARNIHDLTKARKEATLFEAAE